MHFARRSITPLKSHAGVRLMRCAHCASITTRELAARCACIVVVLSCIGDVGTFGSLTRVCSVFPSGCPRPLCMQVFTDFADNHDGSVELPLLQHLAAADCKYTGVVVMNAIHRFPLHALPLVIPVVHRPSQQR